MKITILGSGTSTGVPMVGCRCPVCTSTDPKDQRSRASILIEHHGQFILVDTSTDLRKQAIREQVPHIDAVLFTHPHADHIHGIDDLRGFHFLHKRVIPCYGTQETLNAISDKFAYIFQGLASAGYAQLLEPHVVAGPFSLGGLTITPVPLLHGSMPASGYRIGAMAYLTDCSAIPDSSLALLEGLDLLIIDGLRYTPHPHHFNIPGAIDMARQLQPRRTVLTHLTHEVPHSDEAKLPAGFCLAYDGMVLEAEPLQ
jgi:phosphoribosyl 1,2-cyclic phosphate phosphodiesterase